MPTADISFESITIPQQGSKGAGRETRKRSPL
jgi:hypothetical protein